MSGVGSTEPPRSEAPGFAGAGAGMSRSHGYLLAPVGVVRSPLLRPEDAPNQGDEGAPNAAVVVDEAVAEALDGIAEGDELFLLTWLHEARRDVLRTHPRGDRTVPLAGVFATRSPDRPNPVGLHRVTVLGRAGTTLRVGPLEAIDGTPVVDIKPVLRAPGSPPAR